MKRHAPIGAEILSSVEFPYPVVPIVRHHHENWDGTGYPDGLKGTDIPLGARILSVVDCYDALTSDRPYRQAMTEEAALAILRERRGTMYDPFVVDTFIAAVSRIMPAQQAAPAPRRAGDRRRAGEGPCGGSPDRCAGRGRRAGGRRRRRAGGHEPFTRAERTGADGRRRRAAVDDPAADRAVRRDVDCARGRTYRQRRGPLRRRRARGVPAHALASNRHRDCRLGGRERAARGQRGSRCSSSVRRGAACRLGSSPVSRFRSSKARRSSPSSRFTRSGRARTPTITSGCSNSSPRGSHPRWSTRPSTKSTSPLQPSCRANCDS